MNGSPSPMLRELGKIVIGPFKPLPIRNLSLSLFDDTFFKKLSLPSLWRGYSMGGRQRTILLELAYRGGEERKVVEPSKPKKGKGKK
ncbi:MAG: hypothetical protein DRJ55_05065 [Thermoprotei archaeon]|nr:hypothetical protein [Candidatus Verstraetearchaeota archaeon]RLE91923.1 MAG: hypothetical protein DRJ55_05065 [Thermoprotei archaeon]